MFLTRLVALCMAAVAAAVVASIFGGIWLGVVAGIALLGFLGGVLVLMAKYLNIVDWPGADEDADLSAAGLADGETGLPRHTGSGA
jgi:hypothetical protein